MSAITGVLILVSVSIVSAQNWSQWRGPLGTGAAPEGNPPIEWSEQQNIKWKTPLPATGFSTPAIWGNDIFLTGSISAEAGEGSRMSVKAGGPVKFIVMAIDRTTGNIKWEKQVREEVPHQGRHPSTTWATNSPCTDGERVYAFFGSRGLYCFTIDGDLLWEKDFGDMDIRMQFGEGCSPRLYGDKLVINWDHEGESFILALNAETGEEIWRKDRDEGTTWMTPLVVEVDGQAQVITGGTKRNRSYNLSNGDLIWEGEGLTSNVIPCPVEADGVVYLMSGYRGNMLRAIRLTGARGDISDTPAELWTYEKNTPYTPSPLLLNGLLYFLKANNGILTCLDVSTGQPHYSNERLDGISGVYSSPVGVQDRVYVLGRDGVTVVIRHGSEFDVMAKNTLDDKFDSSPAIVGDEIYLRGYNYLYCIARQ
ncbi:MAG: PQQ-binding-like beta-propeller repeat protein [bacterium]|nr:PQQ-binding-like beta-propeller repeat protein [bacterium]